MLAVTETLCEKSGESSQCRYGRQESIRFKVRIRVAALSGSFAALITSAGIRIDVAA